MTKTTPSEYKSKAAFAEWMLSRAESLAEDLRRSAPHKGTRPAIDLRLQMANLLQCADFVLECSAAGANLANRASSLDAPEYVALDMGRLRTEGYIEKPFDEGTLAQWRRGIILPFRIDTHDADEADLRIGPPREEQRITITTTFPSFGGRRFWFVCPGLEAECGNRVLRLYREVTGGPFACHACHRAAHDGGWRSARDRTILVTAIERAS